LQVDTVVIAKMDGTENEHPDVEVKGFPTIIFYPAGKDAKPITFDGGDRSLKVGRRFDCAYSATACGSWRLCSGCSGQCWPHVHAFSPAALISLTNFIKKHAAFQV
jgi:hypothetical protein